MTPVAIMTRLEDHLTISWPEHIALDRVSSAIWDLLTIVRDAWRPQPTKSSMPKFYHITNRNKHFWSTEAALDALKAPLEAVHAHVPELMIGVDSSDCRAIGATGAMEAADIGVLSFNPYRNLGVLGKGGAIVTGDPELLARCASVAYHGYEPGTKKFKRSPFGFNSRLDNSQAAVSLARLGPVRSGGLLTFEAISSSRWCSGDSEGCTLDSEVLYSEPW